MRRALGLGTAALLSRLPESDDNQLDGGIAMQQRINLAWLIRLRWAAVVGQTLAIGVARLLGVHLPLPPVLALVAVLALSNLAVQRWAQRAAQVSETQISLLIGCDIMLICAQLSLTGGSSNPFHFLFLVHIALASVTLGAAYLAAILTLTCSCFFALYWWYVPLTMGSQAHLPVRLHGEGTAVAFVVAAALIVYFVHRVARALRVSELELAAAREASARSERLSSLVTLAAGAAHELSTPLATIAIVAKESERHLEQRAAAADGALLDDARLIRREVERCRAVLAHLASDAGTSTGEPNLQISAPQLLAQVLAELPRDSRVCLDWQEQAARICLLIPSRSVTQAVRSVVKNALQAANAAHPRVCLTLRCDAASFVIRVEDNGPGIHQALLSRVGEPFFTTKPAGVGMGLGLFLTRTVLQNLGGDFALESLVNRGTTAILRLPIHSTCREDTAADEHCVNA